MIYADFRVKSSRNEEGRRSRPLLCDLEQSFKVILDKLDNVDQAKRASLPRGLR